MQDGLGRKIGDLVQYTTQFVFAFVIAFYYNWKLTLVLLSAFPFIALSGMHLLYLCLVLNISSHCWYELV